MAKIYRDKSGSYYGSSSYLTEKQQKFNAQCVLKYCKQLSDLGGAITLYVPYLEISLLNQL